MKEVSFERLALTGFGPYRDKVEVTFKDGINAYVAPNEHGKSSLVMGILATIFGLPTRTDPSTFGHARFRNWENPPRFEGEVEFEADGVVYRIRRDFDTHKVSLAKLENGRYIGLVTGEHNPGATRKPNVAYETKLAEIFGMTSRELFESTFCVTQPVPEAKRLDEKVQELLSGAGASFARALASLTSDLSAQTKSTGDRGVTPRNQRNDRRLEDLVSRIEALESEIDSARHTVDSLQAVRKRLAEVERELDETRRALASKDAILNAWSEWRRLAAEYRRATRDQAGLEAAVEQARDLSNKIDAEARDVRETYPEFEGAPADVDARLGELVSLKEKLAEVARGISEAENAVRSRQAELDRLESELRALRDWGALGPGAEAVVRSARRKAIALLQRWHKFLEQRNELAACEADLAARFRVFAEASPDELQLVESYSARLAELARDVETARREMEIIEERMSAFERRRDEHARRYAGIASLGPGAGGTIRRKLDALRRERELRTALAEREQMLVAPRGLRAAAGLASAVVAGVVAWLLVNRSNSSARPGGVWISLAAAVLFGLAGYLVLGALHARRVGGARLEVRELEAELARCRQELAGLDEALGALASSDEAELGALQAKVDQRDEEARELAEEQALIATEEETRLAREAFERARQNHEAFVKTTSKFAECFEDVDAALSEWKAMLDKKRRLDTFIRDFAREAFGCDSGAVTRASPSSPDVSDAWRELAHVVAVASSPDDVRTVGDLVAFLESCEPSWWDQVASEAARHGSISREIQTARAAIAAENEHIEASRARVSKFEEMYAAASGPLGAILAASSGDPAGARQRWAERRSRIERVERMRASLATLLAQYGAASADKLREKRTSAFNKAAQALADWKRLVSQNPGLPETDEADDVERIDARWRSLAEDVERLRSRVAELEKERGDLSAEQGRLEGRTPVNIAQAQVELARLKRQREDVELLADALTVACVELTAAIADYQKSYRGQLENAATEHFRRITGVRDRAVVIDDDFKVRVEDGGVPCDPSQLSKGAQDQLYIALRLAIADLLAQDYRLPLIFDDPFATCDSTRLTNLGAALRQIARDRQVLVMSHIESLLAWGTPIEVRRPDHQSM
ncbi:MAG: AAA family ATPase [Betaproteobacteria bacterium]